MFPVIHGVSNRSIMHQLVPSLSSRSAGKNMHRSSTEEDSSSEEEMEWSSNNMLLTNLSIPQLDGTADENGGK